MSGYPRLEWVEQCYGGKVVACIKYEPRLYACYESHPSGRWYQITQPYQVTPGRGTSRDYRRHLVHIPCSEPDPGMVAWLAAQMADCHD